MLAGLAEIVQAEADARCAETADAALALAHQYFRNPTTNVATAARRWSAATGKTVNLGVRTPAKMTTHREKARGKPGRDATFRVFLGYASLSIGSKAVSVLVF